ncbi:DNA cytosine methyltransferase [Alcaligenaceae bacterium]|nr:DNA cytosine methyltransferase [Alcaligenaceae bacterium]
MTNQPQLFGFYEFFAGGGMARMGLGDSWNCMFANDFDSKKGAVYAANFGEKDLHVGDVAQVLTSQLPGRAMLAWGSFPCQDLSLAGNGKGLAGSRSGVFWAFWKLLNSLRAEQRMPPIIALENVSGLITSHGGKDLAALVECLAIAGYRVGALEVDAAHFVPQSRPRLFIVAMQKAIPLPKGITAKTPNPAWHRKKLQDVVEALSANARKSWVWWKLPMPEESVPHLEEIIEDSPASVQWHRPEETMRLLEMMTAANLAKVNDAKKTGSPQVGTIYKRTRDGIQRAEIRFDGLSGCLRTPSGGSSRQIVMVVDGKKIRSRLISSRETARLMGIPDTYKLPERYNEAYHLTGDGVVVPVVAHLAEHILAPIALSVSRVEAEAQKHAAQNETLFAA